MKILRTPQQGPRAGWVQVAFWAFVAAWASVAARLAKPRKQRGLEDAPTSLTLRGAYIPLVFGREEVRPVHFLVGNRTDVGNETPDWREGGGQAFAVGPVSAVHGIYQEGAPIKPVDALVFPLTPQTHPSGTEIYIEGFGGFRIYWGEADQPVDPLVSGAIPNPGSFDIDTRLPGAFYLSFQGNVGKDLGPAAIWDQISVELETRIQRTGLLLSAPRHEASESEGDPIALVGVKTDPPGISPFPDLLYPFFGDGAAVRVGAIGEDHDEDFPIGTRVLVSDASSSAYDGIYRVSSLWRETPGFLHAQAVGFLTYPDGDEATYVRLTPKVDWDGITATVTPLADEQSDGINAAHAIDQLLFGGAPYGMALRRERFEIESLEAIGVALMESPIPLNMAALDGTTVEAMLSRIFQDYAIVRTWAPDGRIRFVRLAPPSEDEIIDVPREAILDPLPELTSIHGPRQSARIAYEFRDRARGFTENQVPIHDDGDAEVLDFAKSKAEKIHSVTDYTSAEIIANRRAQEDLGDLQAIDVFLGRECRQIRNGQVLRLAGIEGTWRVMSRTPDPLSSRTRFKLVRDVWDVDPAEGAGDPGSGGGTITETDPIADPFQAVLDVPPWWTAGSGTIRLALLRGRAHKAITGANVWASTVSEGIAQNLGVTQGSMAVVSLIADMPAGGATILGDVDGSGPQVALYNAETGALIDLSDDQDAWLAGTQVAIIGGGANAEVCFLRELAADGDLYRLSGLIRGRYDTIRRDWPAGTAVYICPKSSVQLIASGLWVTNATRYIKAPAATATASMQVADAEEIAHVVAGKGVVPVRPTGLRVYVDDPTNGTFQDGDSISAEWCQRRAAGVDGYGQVPYGTAIPTVAAIGTFVYRLYDGDGTLLFVQDVGAVFGAIFTYAELFTGGSALLPDLGATHADRSFYFGVTHKIGGVESPEIRKFMEAI